MPEIDLSFIAQNWGFSAINQKKIRKYNMTAFCRKRLLLLLLIRRRQHRRNTKYRKRFLVRRILQRRKEQGGYANLIREIQLGDHESFFKYCCMFPTVFEKLLRLVSPLIVKSDQKWKIRMRTFANLKHCEEVKITLRTFACEFEKNTSRAICE